LPVNNFDRIDDYLAILGDFMKQSHGVRRFGAAALDLCFTAEGTFDAFYEINLSPWDVAAGALIVKEAGGKVTDFQGNDNYIFGKTIIASNSNTHNEVFEIIKNRREK